MLEDVEVRLQRVADVDVALVAAGPEERLAARDVLDVVGDDAAVVQDGVLLPRRSRRRQGRRRGSRRGTRTRARSARRRRPAGGRACPASVSTASKAMDPTTVSDIRLQEGSNAPALACWVGMTTFAELGLSEQLLQALNDVGYQSPSPIQEQAIPPLLEGRDVIGQAQTGTGKTAAFGLPLLESVDPTEDDVQALVLTPTRELCIQVTQALRAYGARKGIDPVAVFGGAPIRTQQAQLRQGGQVVVGTVGRVLDLISRHSLVLHSCRYIVLDEADEMLDLGFLEDVEKILSLAPGCRQTALFSATMPTEIRKLAERHLYDPVDGQGQGRDADDRHRRAVLRRDQAAGQGRDARARARVRAPGPGDRLRPHEDPHRAALPHAARQGHERQGAARRHEPGRARRRDDQLQGRPHHDPRRHRRRRPRPGHLDGHPHRQLRRPDLARRLRAPHRPHRPGRALRPRDHVRRAAPAARARGDRAPRVDEDRAVGRGRARRADAPPSRARAATASRTTRS